MSTWICLLLLVYGKDVFSKSLSLSSKKRYCRWLKVSQNNIHSTMLNFFQLSSTAHYMELLVCPLIWNYMLSTSFYETFLFQKVHYDDNYSTNQKKCPFSVIFTRSRKLWMWKSWPSRHWFFHCFFLLLYNMYAKRRHLFLYLTTFWISSKVCHFWTLLKQCVLIWGLTKFFCSITLTHL